MVSTGKKVIVTTTTHMAYEPEPAFAKREMLSRSADIEKYGYTVAASLDQNKSKIGSLTEEALVRMKGQADCILSKQTGAKMAASKSAR